MAGSAAPAILRLSPTSAPFPSLLQRLLLLPLLTPLLAALLVAAVNPRPSASLRLLTWRSPSLPLGVWIAAAAAGGAGLSASAAALALRQSSPGLRRRVRRREANGRYEQPEPWAAAPRQERQERPPTAAPSRAPGEPAPTMSVPFRV
ncbi:MAG TPA: hypothetical protein VER57_01720, partial [Cyanobium sp.]|nr:hypothetical protein [Cyanobium sp.]